VTTSVAARTFAWLTPTGVAAVAVVALRGAPDELELQDRRGRTLAWPAPGHTTVARLMSGPRVLDEVLAVGREGGGELHVHGGPGVVEAVGRHLREHGFVEERLSLPAEPRCERHLRALASAADGPLARLLQEARSAVTAGTTASDLRQRLRRALALTTFGRRLAEGACVRLVGEPNAGKSTLFNALLGDRRALVSPRAGTTRDTVTTVWRLRGVPVTLEDTAGRVATAAMTEGADVVVHLLGEPAGVDGGSGAARVLPVLGKADLRDEGAGPLLAVSGITGEGLPELADRLGKALGLDVASEEDVWTPLEPLQVALLEAAEALPGPVG
jgi:tRNA modification GTPase